MTPGSEPPLDRYRVLLLDMHSTFMFGEDRFGPGEDFAATYAAIGGRSLDPAAVRTAVRAAHEFLAGRYADAAYEDDFPTVDEALHRVRPDLSPDERVMLTTVFAQHECGSVPRDHARALADLRGTHELRLISNIWAPKARWLTELSRADVLGLFDRTVFSSDTRSIKPSATIFRAALEGVRCSPSEILMIGDSMRADMLGARRVGLATAWISPAMRPLEPALAPLVDYCIPSLVALAGTHARRSATGYRRTTR